MAASGTGSGKMIAMRTFSFFHSSHPGSSVIFLKTFKKSRFEKDIRKAKDMGCRDIERSHREVV